MTILTDVILRPQYCVILWTNGARCALNKEIHSMRKAFLERAVVELVYKFDEKSTAKGKSITKVPFKQFWGSYTYMYIYIYLLHTSPVHCIFSYDV